MKKKIIVLLAAFVCLLTTLFTAGMVKTYAASTPYSLATYFTFSCDMDIDKGFELIKPYILYRNDSACFENYTFKAEEENDGFYRYTGTYPDGTPFSIHSKIRIINDPSGTYVEALNFEATRQSIVVTSLRSGKKTSDCLNECWKNRYICVKDPTYYMETGFAPNSDIYNHASSYTNGAGENKTLWYYAIYDPSSNPISDNPNNEEIIDVGGNTTPNPSNNEDVDIPNTPSETEEPTTPNNPINNNPQETNNNQNTNSNSNNNQVNKSKDGNNMNPLTIALICIGAIVGIILIYEIYKIIRLLILWLKR